MIQATSCLPVGSYSFILYDAKGDGICCSYGRGEYGINLSKGRVIRPLSSGRFTGAGEVTPFQVTADDIDIRPAMSPSAAPSSIGNEESNGADLAAVLPPSTDADAKRGPCAWFSMELVPDRMGNETSWQVLKESLENERLSVESSQSPTYYPTSHPTRRQLERFLRDPNENSLRKARRSQEQWTVVLAGGPYSYSAGSDAFGSHNNAIISTTCLPQGSYKFILHDAKGDGICCGFGHGEYALTLAGRAIRPMSPGSFIGTEEDTHFEVALEDIDALPISLSSSEDSESTANNWHPTTSINSLASLVTVSGVSTPTAHKKAYGILFSVACAASLAIAGMDLYLDTYAETDFQIWTKPGSWQDVDAADPDYFSGFRQISHGRILGNGASDFARVSLQDFADVEIKAGKQQAFYVTLTDNKLVFENYEGEGMSRHEMGSAVQAETDEFKVFYGTAVREYPLELADPVTDFWYNAGFLGRLWYKKSEQ